MFGTKSVFPILKYTVIGMAVGKTPQIIPKNAPLFWDRESS